MTAQSQQACKELNVATKLSPDKMAEEIKRIIGRFGLRLIGKGTYATNDGGRIKENNRHITVNDAVVYEVLQ